MAEVSDAVLCIVHPGVKVPRPCKQRIAGQLPNDKHALKCEHVQVPSAADLGPAAVALLHACALG